MRMLAQLLPMLCAPGAVAGSLLGPSPYLQASDSPFAAIAFQSFAVENFEDGAFNLPNATISGGTPTDAGGVFTDSVDGDDGAIDGSGLNGRSWYSGNLLAAFEVSFSPVLGQYPTHAGLVWTDVGATSQQTGFGDVTFEAFGVGGGSLGSVLLASAGDGAATGATAEDRFFGVVNLGGIERIRISMSNSVDWEIDHVQAGIVPEPGTAALLVLLGAVVRRR